MKKIGKIFLSFFMPTDPTSKHYGDFLYCLFKIGICVLCLLLLGARKSFFDIKDITNKWIGIISFPFVVALLFKIYITVAELGYGKRDRSDPTGDRQPLALNIEEVVMLAKKNDIIEFIICFNDELIKCGSSADSTPTLIFDKRYYVGTREFYEINEFALALSDYSMNGHLEVMAIDDTDPRSFQGFTGASNV